MAWCEANRVEYVLGLARNARLQRAIGKELHEAKHTLRGSRARPCAPFVELAYRTKEDLEPHAPRAAQGRGRCRGR